MRASGNGGLIPPDAPRACPGRDLILRKSGRPDLRWGRAGEGGRSYCAKLHPPTATPTPTPNPSPQGGGEQTVRVATVLNPIQWHTP